MARILVIKHGALGDMIIGFAAFQAIRAHHPGASIILLTTAPYAALGRQMPWFDEVWIDERPRWWQCSAWWRLARRVAAAGFQRVYDLQGNDRTALLFHLLPRRCRPEWSGPVRGASHPRPPRDGKNEHVRAWVVRQLASAGIMAVPPADLGWLDGAIGRFSLPEKSVLMVPGCSPGRPEKRWPAEHYAALAGRLLSRGLTPVLLGSTGEADLTARIAAGRREIVDLAGQTTPGDIAALARHAIAAVGNDTGPMHLIAQTGCPTLVLFSSASNPARISPVGPAVQTLQKSKLNDLSVEQVEATLVCGKPATKL